ADNHLSVIDQELTQARKLLQSETGRRQSPDTPASKNEGARRDETGKTGAAGRNEATRQGANPSPNGSDDKDATKKSSQAKAPRRDAKASERPETALRQVAENQEAVLDSLSEMLQTLAQWRTEHDVSRELGDVIRQ